MKTERFNPKLAIASIFRNRRLIYVLTKRAVDARYRGSMMGILWAFVTPILMLIVYTFVFSVIFQSRWNAASTSKTEFALLLFLGLILFNLFAECVSQAPSLIISNANLTKKVVFPLEILPLVTMGVAIVNACFSLIVWLIAYGIIFGAPSATILLTPIVILPLILTTIGLSWIISAVGVYVRDTSQVTAIFVMICMFMSPIFYPATAIPEEFRVIVFINPLAITIDQIRSLLFFGEFIDTHTYIANLLFSLAIAWIGFVFFQKVRPGFADVL